MRHAIATLILAILLVLAWWFFGQEESPQAGRAETAAPSRQPLTADRKPMTAHREPQAADAPRRRGSGLPGSLDGTEVDGFLMLDDRDRFVADANAIRLFDYFLSTEGEISLAEIRRLMEAEAARQVPSDQLPAVMALFDGYLRYRSESARLAERFERDEIGEHLDALVELQEEIFGQDVARRTFGEQNLLAKDAIARRELYQDETLSWEEKRSRLAELDTQLPEPIREIRQRIQRPAEVAAVVAQMRRDGVDEDEVFAYRADEFGPEAAERFARLDQEQAQWNARLDAYRTERDAILARNLSESVRNQAIEALRAEHFSGTEVTRVRVLDEMDANR